MRQALLLVFVFLSGLAQAQNLAPIPDLTARVTDATGTLGASQQQALETKLAAFEQEKGSQVAVLIVPTTGGEAIEAYSIRVAEKWKIGRAKVDDGVILLIALSDHKMRIEVGYGLEGAIPDAKAFRIIDETLKPAFRSGDFYGGIDKATDQIIGLIKGEDLPAPKPAYRELRFQKGFGGLLVFLYLLGYTGVDYITRKLGRFPGAASGGALGGVLAWLFFGQIAAGLALGAVVFFFLLMRWGSGAWAASRGWGSSSGFGSSGGFGGGFSGGGGGFGGGGASGGW